MKDVQHIHCIGIGGVGISALARLLVGQGKVVSGTEDNESPETLNPLRAQGVVVSLNLIPSQLPMAEYYIYSDAWLTKHPDVLAEARTRNVPVKSYFEALGEIANKYKVIAVAGAHGKTTTTAMLIDVLEAGGLDPVGIVGSLRIKTGSNFRGGRNSSEGEEYFVVEADEYRRHFMEFSPYILVILNIDADHLDYYKDLAEIESAFHDLALKIPKDGFIVCNALDEKLRPVIANVSCAVVDYMNYFDPALSLNVLSLHRVNAAAVLAVAEVLHISVYVARTALAEFTGTWRRFEYKGKTKKGADVYDDYGHHPTEVRTTLKSIRETFPNRKIFIVFQPHLYSRTKILFNEFVHAFDDADDIIIAPIFAAREAPDPSISHSILAEKIVELRKHAMALDSFDEVHNYLAREAHEGDLVITMGAGDIYKVGEKLVSR